jgi:hypothetical protein
MVILEAQWELQSTSPVLPVLFMQLIDRAGYAVVLDTGHHSSELILFRVHRSVSKFFVRLPDTLTPPYAEE